MATPDRIQVMLQEFLPEAQAIEIRATPRTGRITLYVLLAMVLTMVAWASFAKMDKLIIAHGRLVTPLPNLVVQPLEPGILREIKVLVGQEVKKGTVLATLDPTFATADTAQLTAKSEALSLRAMRLETELLGHIHQEMPAGTTSHQWQLQTDMLAERHAAYAAKMRQYEENHQRLLASLETNRQDQQAQANRLKSSIDLEKIFMELMDKQVGSRAKLLEVQDKRLEVERDYVMSQNKEKEIQHEIAANEAESTNFSRTWNMEAMDKLSTILQDRDEANEQLAKAKRRSELSTLIAPQDAIVLEIGKISVGSVVKDAEMMFVLVPLAPHLEAEVEVDPADIGEIRMDDVTRIKIDAYPFQKHGVVAGKVINVGADTFNRQSATGAQSYYYLARIGLENTHLEHLPSPTRLIPGMTLTGEIVTGKRSVISYFLYPVIRVLDESFRER